MIFAAPIVGRVLAACAASQASANAAPVDSSTTATPQIGKGGAVNATAFAQALDNIEQATGLKPPRAAVATI